MHNAGVVFKLNCSCRQSCIGKADRNLVTRIQEYVPNKKLNQEPDVAKHLVRNPNHKINFDSPEILGHSNNPRKLRIKETLLILKIQPHINLDGASQPIYLFDTYYRVTIRPDLGGTVPLFQALSRPNHQKWRFFLQSTSTAWSRVCKRQSRLPTALWQRTVPQCRLRPKTTQNVQPNRWWPFFFFFIWRSPLFVDRTAPNPLTMAVGLQKKKRSSPVWLHVLCRFQPKSSLRYGSR